MLTGEISLLDTSGRPEPLVRHVYCPETQEDTRFSLVLHPYEIFNYRKYIR